jgi:tetratricopeptide (TPR) repeat protein
LTGLDLAEAKLASGDVTAASAMAQKVLAEQTDTIQSTADGARAHFIMARVDLLTGHPDAAIDDFQKTLAMSKEQRLLSWSHIYLGRMLDLECKRDEALAEYKEALAVRDGQLDTRLAAERGIKSAYVQRGHEHDCEDESGDDAPGTAPQQSAPRAPTSAGNPGAAATVKPEPQAQDGAPKPQ